MFCGTLLASTLAWAEPSVHFVAPVDGATVGNPIQVKMAVDGMKVMPAGELVAGTGHHHLIVDGQPVPMGEAVPADTTHLHFGKGQTETELTLPPGKHTLTLQFADGKHQSYGPALSQTIEVNVK
jgi:uncharacterized protein YfaP (DUF2135 family)